MFEQPALSKTLVVGLAGGSGSGKTTLVKALKEALGDKVTVISADSYYKDLSHLSEQERAERNFDAPDAIDFKTFIQHIYELKQGNSIECPSYDFVTHTRLTNTKTVQPNQVIVIEGILIYAIPELRDLIDVRIFLDVSSDERLLRRLIRDVKERGRTLESVRKQYLATVAPMYRRHVRPTKRHAHIIIPFEGPNEIAVQFIKQQILGYCKTS